jgi:thymidine kinase
MVDSQELEVIGGAEVYSAVSRSNFIGRPTAGEVHLTVDPVKSGKKTELLRTLKRYQIARRRPVLIRSPKGSLIDGVQLPVITTGALPTPEEMEEFDTIGIDEALRFANVAEWADEMANGEKLIEVSALDSNYERELFANIVECVSVSERFQKLDSICPIMGLPAPFSAVHGGVYIPISRCGLARLPMALDA